MAYVTQRRIVARRGERQLGDLGIQIGPKLRLGGSVGKVAGNAQRTVKKAVVDTGHTVGKVASNKYVIGAEAALLAATGAGAAAIPLLALQKGGANLVKPGGNAKSAFTGAYQGAIVGAGAALAPSLIRGGMKVGGKLINVGASGVKKIGSTLFPGNNGGGDAPPADDTAPITNDDATAAAAGIAKRKRTVAGAKGGESIEDTIRRLLGGSAPVPATATTSSNGVVDSPAPQVATMTTADAAGGLLSSPYVIPIALVAAVLLTRSSGGSRRSAR